MLDLIEEILISGSGVFNGTINTLTFGAVSSDPFNFRSRLNDEQKETYDRGVTVGKIGPALIPAFRRSGTPPPPEVELIPLSPQGKGISIPVEIPLFNPGPTITQSKSNSSGGNTNGNSKKSTKPQHNYDIQDTHTKNRVVKTGTSGGKQTKTGQSYRGNSQANKWNKQEKTPGRYKSKTTNQVPGGRQAREKALDYEVKRANKVRKQLDPPRPWFVSDKNKEAPVRVSRTGIVVMYI